MDSSIFEGLGRQAPTRPDVGAVCQKEVTDATPDVPETGAKSPKKAKFATA